VRWCRLSVVVRSPARRQRRGAAGGCEEVQIWGIHSPYVVAPNPNWKVVAHTSVVCEGNKANAVKPATRSSGGDQPNPVDGSRVKNPDDTSAGAKGNSGGQQEGGRGQEPAPAGSGGGSTQGGSSGGPATSLGNKRILWPVWAVAAMASAAALPAGL
jgi:hypothetical protein